jgi:hypothetical protein
MSQIREMNMKRMALLALAVAACSPAAKEAPVPVPTAIAPLYLGVLEDRAPSTTGETNRFMVRVAFQKDATGWKSLDPQCSKEACLSTGPASVPAEIDWTIVLHGESKGAVKAVTPAKWGYYSDEGTQDLATGATPPTEGERSMDFAGWAETPVYRPLVATSAPNFADPDKWAPAPLAAPVQTGLLQAFRAKFASIQNCKSPEENTLKPVAYQDADVAVSDTFVSAKGWSIATANLKDYRCDGGIDDTAYAPQTFAVAPDGKAVFMGEGLKLLDAGDYDADGKSEVIFAISTYNRGGYDLRYNDFSGQSLFEVGYH